MTTNDTVVYYAADTFGMPLYLFESRFRGADHRVQKLGPFSIDFDVVVTEDVLVPGTGGFFVQFKGNLWAYLLVFQTGDQRLHFFDASVVGLKVKALAKFGGPTPQDTVAKLSPAIRASYSYARQTWSKDAAQDMGTVAVQ